jgi:hypothetical protein
VNPVVRAVLLAGCMRVLGRLTELRFTGKGGGAALFAGEVSASIRHSGFHVSSLSLTQSPVWKSTRRHEIAMDAASLGLVFRDCKGHGFAR